MGTKLDSYTVGTKLDSPRRGGSNEYPQYMFWIKNNNEKNRYTPVNPSFAIYKSGV